MDMINVEYFAHRGASYGLPENTLHAVEQVAISGVKGIEIDVRLTLDGEVVLAHDPDLKKSAGIDRKISDLTFEELKKVNVAQYLKDYDREESVPKLSDVLKLCNKYQLKCAIELKPEESINLVEKVYNLIKKHKVENLVFIYSFSEEMIKEFSRKNPSFPLHLNLAVDPLPYVQLAKENGWGLNPKVTLVTKEFVGICRDENIDVHVWTVNDSEMKQLLECWGIATIISDDLPIKAPRVDTKHAHKR